MRKCYVYLYLSHDPEPSAILYSRGEDGWEGVLGADAMRQEHDTIDLSVRKIISDWRFDGENRTYRGRCGQTGWQFEVGPALCRSKERRA
jgi:hypothetical protein